MRRLTTDTPDSFTDDILGSRYYIQLRAVDQQRARGCGELVAYVSVVLNSYSEGYIRLSLFFGERERKEKERQKRLGSCSLIFNEKDGK